MIPIHLALVFAALLARSPAAPVPRDHSVDMSPDGETSDVFELIDYPFSAGISPR